MAEPSPGTPAAVKPPEDRLDSWKEIAAYLNRDVTTVQRWEKREGMPVHRHLHDRMGSVYAFRAELDAWARGRKSASCGRRRGTALSSPNPPTPLQSFGVEDLQREVCLAAGSGGNRAADWRELLDPEDGVLLAKPHRGRAISTGHGLRRSGAGRCVVT